MKLKQNGTTDYGAITNSKQLEENFNPVVDDVHRTEFKELRRFEAYGFFSAQIQESLDLSKARLSDGVGEGVHETGIDVIIIIGLDLDRDVKLLCSWEGTQFIQDEARNGVVPIDGEKAIADANKLFE